jgi:hypothetical protein
MKNKLDFFTIIISMFIITIGLIYHTFRMTGLKFYGELLVILIVIFFTIISLLLISNEIDAGYVLIAIIAILSLLNFILIYFRKGMTTFVFASIISSITAFVVSVVNIGGKKEIKKKVNKEDKEGKKEEKPVIKTYTPGKVVASKTSKYYHAPKCDWAKKIKKSNQVWYDTDIDAKKENLEPHTCLE